MDESPYTLTDGTVCKTIAWTTLNPFCLRFSKYCSAPSRSNLLNSNQPVSPSQKKGLPSSVIKYLPFSDTFKALISDESLPSSEVVEVQEKRAPANANGNSFLQIDIILLLGYPDYFWGVFNFFKGDTLPRFNTLRAEDRSRFSVNMVRFVISFPGRHIHLERRFISIIEHGRFRAF